MVAASTGTIEFLDRAERLAEFAAHLGADFAERVEDGIFAAGAGMGSREGIAAEAIDGIENQIVAAADLRDGAGEDRFASGALADFVGDACVRCSSGGLPMSWSVPRTLPSERIFRNGD